MKKLTARGLAPIVIILIVAVALALAGGGYLWWWNQQNKIKHITPAVPNQQQTPTESIITSPPPPEKAEKTCAERTTPAKAQYGLDDPRDYLGPFLNSLKLSFSSNDARATVKCFFDNLDIYTEGNSLYALNLYKNFSEFSFYINSWTTATGEVELIVTDPEFTQNQVKLYTRKIGEQWKILAIKDLAGVLK